MSLRRTTMGSPIGRLILMADDEGLTRILFANQELADLDLDDEDAPEVDDDPVLVATAQQLTQYFAGDRTSFELPLHLEGTEFQRTAWMALASSWLSTAIGSPMAAST